MPPAVQVQRMQWPKKPHGLNHQIVMSFKWIPFGSGKSCYPVSYTFHSEMYPVLIFNFLIRRFDEFDKIYLRETREPISISM
jgi:hypothetical protein